MINLREMKLTELPSHYQQFLNRCSAVRLPKAHIQALPKREHWAHRTLNNFSTSASIWAGKKHHGTRIVKIITLALCFQKKIKRSSYTRIRPFIPITANQVIQRQINLQHKGHRKLMLIIQGSANGLMTLLGPCWTINSTTQRRSHR